MRLNTKYKVFVYFAGKGKGFVFKYFIKDLDFEKLRIPKHPADSADYTTILYLVTDFPTHNLRHSHSNLLAKHSFIIAHRVHEYYTVYFTADWFMMWTSQNESNRME